MSNARSPFQTRPEKAFLRLIIWDGTNWKSLFIDNWRCNHVMDDINYRNEMEQLDKYKPLVLYKKRNDAQSVKANTAPGKGTTNSVRFREYSRDCKTREEEGRHMPYATDEARKQSKKAPQSAGKKEKLKKEREKQEKDVRKEVKDVNKSYK